MPSRLAMVVEVHGMLLVRSSLRCTPDHGNLHMGFRRRPRMEHRRRQHPTTALAMAAAVATIAGTASNESSVVMHPAVGSHEQALCHHLRGPDHVRPPRHPLHLLHDRACCGQ